MTGTVAVPAPVVAVSAEAFEQSIGVNIHLWETGSSYTNLALVEGALDYLGVTNVRDQLVTWSQTQSEYTALMAQGYKFDFIEEPVLQNIPTFVSAIQNFETTYPGSILAVEGPNEVNLQPVTYNGGSGLINAAEFQQALDSAVRADPALSNIPVYNLTMAYLDTTQYGQLGNLSQAANDANSHAYVADSQTPASGLSVILPYAQLDAPGLPTVITETGYNTNPADTYSGVDQTVQAKLTLDTLMDAFKDGVSQTYLYELLDDASGNWGLFNADGTPKLAATAVHNLTTILADPGSPSSFVPGSLSYSVPDLPANGNQFLLEKSNGTFDLVVWAEADIWNPTTQSEVLAPTETSTVEFGQAEALVQVFDPLQGTTPIATYSNVSSIQVSLSDHPLIIQISGGTATTAATLAPPPTVSSLVESSSTGDLNAGKTVTLTLNLSEAVTVAGGTPTLTLNDGATAIYAGGSGTGALTFSYTVAAGQNTSDLTATAVNLNSATITDGAGNAANLSLSGLTQTGPQIDTTAPTASSLVESSSTGDLNAGKTVTLTLNLSEAVTVAGGTPTLTLNDGATATYTGGSGTGTLTFSYIVAAGQNTSDLTASAVNLNSATITDGAGNAANLSLSSLSQTGPQIDTTPPTAPAITNDVVNANNSVTLTGTAEANSTVTVYDGQTALGTTTANASGAWSYSTGVLANGSQVFSATAADAAGNTSAASTAVDPIIGALTGTLSGTHSVANGATLSITGTVNNTGTIALNAAGSGADLAIIGAATLTGAGKVMLSNNTGNIVGSNGATATLTNVNDAISGAGTIGDSHLTLNNQGTINANSSLALIIGTGSNTVTNSGTLEATSTGGLDIDANVSNSKTIEALGTNAKVVIQGVITDTSSGLILASGSGAQVDLSNATISGGTLQTSGSNAFIETVAGANTFNGGAISSGSTVEVNSGTTLAIGGTVKNSGTLLVNGGTLDVVGALSGGVTDISGTGKMLIAAASGENVTFIGNSTGQLVLDQAPSYTGQISGFGTTQSIDLADINFSAGVTMSYASSNRRNTSGVLTIKQGSNTVRLELAGSYTLANFRVASDGNGGTLLTDPTVVAQQPGNKTATIGNDAVLEVNTRDSGNVTFAGTNGTLWLDQPSTFTGKVSGLGAQNGIDLSSIAFGAHTTLGYSPNNNNTGGTLSITNGAQSASIALLGSYMASSFVMGSDNHGGTMILADATQSANQSLLTNPQHS